MYSFDVFDTLITRCTAEPKGIFMLVQELVKTSGKYEMFLADNFYELRIGAEKLARAHASTQNKQEITLHDIYEALSTAACITERQQEELEKLEIEVEYNNVLGITENINFFKELLMQEKQVVLISDMYLGEVIIRHMLEKVDPVFQKVPLYVSVDYGVTKESGGLFQIVKDKESVDYADWTHYGDSEYADMKPAVKLGINSKKLMPETIKEYEQPQSDLYHQLSIGASRYVRMTIEKSVVNEIGSSLAGPILYPYVKWVLQESIAKQINRLYFVARDGWILKQIADVIIQVERYPIKTYYIYGSRKAWRLPAYDGSLEDFDRILRWSNMSEVLCLNDLALIFRLRTEELRGFLNGDYKDKHGEQELSEVERDSLCKQLSLNVSFREYLVQKQADNRRTLIKYLQQEIDVSDDRFAFVELSGTGFTQKCLAGIIGNFYQGEIKNFYYKLDTIQENGKCIFFNFYPSWLQRSYMLELLCRAPHGQTESYIEKDEYIFPVLESLEGEQTRVYGAEQYRDAVLAYVDQMEHIYISNKLPYVAQMKILREYMNVIAEKPPERVAKYFCYMPFSSGGRQKSIVEFAPPVTKKQLRKIYFWKSVDNFRRVYQGDTLDYALLVSPEARRYKESCQIYRKKRIGRWLVEGNRYLRTRQKPGTAFFCPWVLLRGHIVIYGAGKVGQTYVRQAKQRYAKCNSLLWVDSDYARLQAEGFDLKSPEEIRNHSFDRIIVAIHNDEAKQEIGNQLLEMGVEIGKIYYA